MTTLALAEPFIASDAAVAFSFFFATEKGLAPAAMSGKRHRKYKVCMKFLI
jgi:hypothetical protein